MRLDEPMTQAEFDEALQTALAGGVTTDTGAGPALDQALQNVAVDPTEQNVLIARITFAQQR